MPRPALRRPWRAACRCVAAPQPARGRASGAGWRAPAASPRRPGAPASCGRQAGGSAGSRGRPRPPTASTASARGTDTTGRGGTVERPLTWRERGRGGSGSRPSWPLSASTARARTPGRRSAGGRSNGRDRGSVGASGRCRLRCRRRSASGSCSRRGSGTTRLGDAGRDSVGARCRIRPSFPFCRNVTRAVRGVVTTP